LNENTNNNTGPKMTFKCFRYKILKETGNDCLEPMEVHNFI